MKLYNIKKSVIGHNVKVSIAIDSKELGKRELWFSAPQKYEYGICENQYDAYLVGLLYPAMRCGEDIHIEGRVSKRLLFNINHYAIPLIKSFSPSCKNIKVTATELTNLNYNGDGVGTVFSGGIDSFCTIYDHLGLENDPDYRINSFLFLNVGAHGSKSEDKVRRKFETRYNYLKRFPEEVGLDFIPVDSNLHDFHPWGHQLTCTLTLASGAMFMQKFYNKYYCASLGWSYLEILEHYKTDLDKDIAMFDPMLLPLLSTESLELISDGNQYTRTEKTLRIIDYGPVKKYLNVCVSGDDTHENCSVCSKCSRTLMTLNSLDRLEEFNHLFDIEKYKKEAEKKYVRKQVALQNVDPFAKGNVELAKYNNIKLPNRLWCLIVWSPNILKQKMITKLKDVLPENAINKLSKISCQGKQKFSSAKDEYSESTRI